MVNESDQINRADYIPRLQYQARDTPIPRFGRPQDVKGGVTRPVRSVAWSCDGRKIATGTEVKGLRIWDAKDKVDSSSSLSLPSGGDKTTPHTGHVAALAFSPVEPHILVSGCKSSFGGATIAVWDITSPKAPVASFKISGDVLHIAFHPSGSQFAVVCPRAKDEVYFYWRIRNQGEEVWEKREDVGLGGPYIESGSEEINSLRFSNSGKLVCAVSNDGSLNAWLYPEAPRIVEPAPIELPKESTENGDADADADASTSASPQPAGDEDADVGKSRAATPREGTPDEDDGGEKGGAVGDAETTDAAVKDDEGADTVGTANGEGVEEGAGEEAREEGRAEAGDVEMGEGDSKVEEGEASKVEEGKGDIEAVSADQIIATEQPVDVEMTEAGAGADAHTETQHHQSGVPKAAGEVNGSAAPSRQPTPPSSKGVAAPEKPKVDVAAEARRKQLKRFRHVICAAASLLSLSFDPTGRFLAVGGQDALLSLFDTRDWICQRTFDVCMAAIRHTAFSHDGELVAMGGDDPFIAIVSVWSGQTIAKIPIVGLLQSICWHPSQNRLAYSTNIKTAMAWYVVNQE
ncbi:hypothetical protein JCM24511_03795 [Saitozyma sp. JCM 24511]|nr:hypothetical protein JCM24511_03795 [Saitozyma sp. JCM 24511]